MFRCRIAKSPRAQPTFDGHTFCNGAHRARRLRLAGLYYRRAEMLTSLSTPLWACFNRKASSSSCLKCGAFTFVPPRPRGFAARIFVCSTRAEQWNLQEDYRLVSRSIEWEAIMGFGRGALLWLLGVPLPIIILLALFWHH